MNQNKRLKGTGELVRDIFMEHPDWNARQIYDRYKIIIGDPNNAVTLNAVQKHIEKLRKKWDSGNFKDLNQLWNLGLLAKEGFTSKYPELTAEAIGVIIDVQKWAEKNNIEKIYDKAYQPVRYGITLRQALWISRLYRAVNKHMGNESEIWRAAWAYSALEIMCELSDEQFDTWQFDAALRKATKMKGNEDFVTLMWNVFGDGSENAYKAQFQMHMASQPIKSIIVRERKDIAEDARQRIKERQANYEDENS